MWSTGENILPAVNTHNPHSMRLTHIPLYFLLLAGLMACTNGHQYSQPTSAHNMSGSWQFETDEMYLSPDPSTGDNYESLPENDFIEVSEAATSTFSIDADGASYANLRRFIQYGGQLPPPEAVRTEEMINFFDLDYSFVDNGHPINLNGEVSSCPWKPENKLVRIGIQGQPLSAERPAANFVFLIDASGSMHGLDRLDLLKEGFKLFAEGLNEEDRVAIVTYAGSAGVVLPATPGSEKEAIYEAIDRLGANGSTAGAEGILTAYEIAEKNFIEGGNNRIVIGTDGDFNVGPVSQEALLELVEAKREAGVYLTVLGVGRGNYNDANLEQIANHGNGTYEYVDNLQQLRKIFLYDYGKFFTVAKDVKVQVKFNPRTVAAYRLIGYENRLLKTEDFKDDRKDAGEIGAGQNITALYEIVPAREPFPGAVTFTIDFRYKEPDATISRPLSLDIYDENTKFEEASGAMRFTAGVAGFAMLLTNSPHLGEATYPAVHDWLADAGLSDEHGLKQELWELVRTIGKLETK